MFMIPKSLCMQLKTAESLWYNNVKNHNVLNVPYIDALCQIYEKLSTKFCYSGK